MEGVTDNERIKSWIAGLSLIHKTVPSPVPLLPPLKNYLAQNASSAKVESKISKEQVSVSGFDAGHFI